MTADRLRNDQREGDNVRELRLVKAQEELSSRAVPPVLDWGPSDRWVPEATPTSLEKDTYQAPDDN